MSELLEKYRSKLLEPFSKEHECFLYWKGRVGLYAILKAAGVGEGDEVILPAFTCVVVPNAIIYLKAKPVYVDIQRTSLNAGFEDIRKARTDRTKAVIVQNTFGLSSELDQISTWCRQEGILSIEDCTHGYGGQFKSKPNGSFCDAAFYSSQWNKPFSTGIGGFVITAHDEHKQGLRELSKKLITPSWTERLSLSLQYFAKEKLLTDANYWNLLRLYRRLTKAGLLTGSSSGTEIENTAMPQDYFKAFSEVQARKGIKELKHLDQVIDQRKQAAHTYTEFLEKHGKYHVISELHRDHSFLKYPILVKERENFFKLAEAAKIRLGDWFISPLHPVKGDLSPWFFDRNEFPVSNEVSSQIVNLPLKVDLNKVQRFLEKHIDQLL